MPSEQLFRPLQSRGFRSRVDHFEIAKRQKERMILFKESLESLNRFRAFIDIGKMNHRRGERVRGLGNINRQLVHEVPISRWTRVARGIAPHGKIVDRHATVTGKVRDLFKFGVEKTFFAMREYEVEAH